MVLDLLAVVLVIVALSLVPICLLAGMFAVVDALADEEKLEEVREARREDRPVDFLDAETTSSPGADAEPSPEIERGLDVPRVRTTGSGRRLSGTTAESKISCPDCGALNSPRFDRCWNCQSKR